MTEPVTEIDTRFSEPGAAAAGWPQTRRVLETAELFWICTVRAASWVSQAVPHELPLLDELDLDLVAEAALVPGQ